LVRFKRGTLKLWDGEYFNEKACVELDSVAQ